MDAQITVREARFDQDAVEILRIDRSFRTDEVFEAVSDGLALRLVATRRGAQLEKTFPLDDLDDPARPYDRGWLACLDGRGVGFAATGLDTWNSRLVLWHFYVDAAVRRRGVGRRLIDAAMADGRERGARNLWLETSSLNVPGVLAYEGLGFRLTGLDMTLYDGTPAQGETALFFSQPIAPRRS